MRSKEVLKDLEFVHELKSYLYATGDKVEYIARVYCAEIPTTLYCDEELDYFIVQNNIQHCISEADYYVWFSIIDDLIKTKTVKSNKFADILLRWSIVKSLN